jgi:putative transposase
MLYVKYPLSLRNVEDLLHERGIDISYETVRCWRNRFGPMFASFRRRERSMLRFRRMETVQKFVSVHANVHTTSTTNATSSIDPPTSVSARPPLPSGRNS